MENKWFSNAGDLEPKKVSNNDSYFRVPGDLESPKENNSFVFAENKGSIINSVGE